MNRHLSLITIQDVRLDKLGEDIPVQLVGGEGAPNEKASAVANDVGEEFHVEEILRAKKGHERVATR